MWIDKDPKFVIYKFRTPAFYPNAQMVHDAEQNDSSKADLERTMKGPDKTASNRGLWDLDVNDQGSSPVPSHNSRIGKNPLIAEIQSV